MRFLANENFPGAAVDDWAGCFSVIEPGRIRMRPLVR